MGEGMVGLGWGTETRKVRSVFGRGLRWILEHEDNVLFHTGQLSAMYIYNTCRYASTKVSYVQFGRPTVPAQRKGTANVILCNGLQLRFRLFLLQHRLGYHPPLDLARRRLGYVIREVDLAQH